LSCGHIFLNMSRSIQSNVFKMPKTQLQDEKSLSHASLHALYGVI
jgi:hypothetical protein